MKITYRVSIKLILTVILIWQFGESRKDHQINLHHYRSIYITTMGSSPHRTEIHQFKIPPTAFSEQTTKYNVHQYFCLYGIAQMFGRQKV